MRAPHRTTRAYNLNGGIVYPARASACGAMRGKVSVKNCRRKRPKVRDGIANTVALAVRYPSHIRWVASRASHVDLDVLHISHMNTDILYGVIFD